ncbi:P-loop containing nucleoside triphosphate hydrolase protein [Amanita muscaria]
MSITSSMYWGCRFWTTLELDLNSVERIIEYLDLPQESPTIIESHRAPAYWPSSASQGALVSVENMTIKYAPDLPPVLHDLSFTLKAEGRIVIDGIDISTIGLHDLRSRITFIPQDATLFSGTLRDNLDPFGDHEDSECLQALYSVQLIGHSSTPSGRPSAVSTPKTSRPASVILHEGVATDSHSIATTSTEVESKTTISLDTQISAGGSNFSQGQRQLIAMARALLRRSTIIILDEATSSIDFATDAKIQTTIREHFTDSLLLTVAHRLRTVIDYDRLVVLDKGRMVEFDTPWNLIQKEEGIFRNMCLKSGSYAELEAVAEQKPKVLRAWGSRRSHGIRGWKKGEITKVPAASVTASSDGPNDAQLLEVQLGGAMDHDGGPDSFRQDHCDVVIQQRKSDLNLHWYTPQTAGSAWIVALRLSVVVVEDKIGTTNHELLFAHHGDAAYEYLQQWWSCG